MPRPMTIASVVSVFFAVACGGAQEEDGGLHEREGAPVSGVKVSGAAADKCPAGGVIVAQGLDLDGNGELEGDEITSEQTLCNGVDGEDGETSAMTASIRCGGKLEDTVNLWFNYSVAQFGNGDVWATASVSGPAYQIGDSTFYSSRQVGFQTAAVIFAYDAMGSANGVVEDFLDRNTLRTSIEYNDGGVERWTMEADACTVNDYTK